MTESKKKNNNLLYTALVIAGLLLLLLPFFIFDLGSSVNGTGHFARFGLHILAFAGALLAGSLFSAGVTQVSGAGSSAVTMKAVAWTAAIVVGTTVTYNTVQYTSPEKKIALNQTVSLDTTSLASTSLPQDTIGNESNEINQDTSSMASSTSINTTEETTNDRDVADNTTIANKVKESAEQKASSGKKTASTTNTPNEKVSVPNTSNSNTTLLSETCNSFQLLHGSKQLDRKLGLSIYDPNKSIRFNNDCGCILKDASMSLSRQNKIVEQKLQTGNFINLHAFKDMQAEDKLTVEIKQANCKDTKGIPFLYTFPKPILTIVLISDHREFETAAELKNNKKNPKETFDNSTVKPIQKDKVEEESNKFGN